MLRPTGSRILVADSPTDAKRESGLIIPDHYNRVKMGIVEDFQEMDHEVAMLGISKGDVIYYTEGCEVEIQSRTIVDAHHVIAIDKMED